jgi:hypothetical protein
MKEQKKDIIDLSLYYGSCKSVELTITGQKYIKILLHSTYGVLSKKFERCSKIKRIINNI